MTIERVFGNGDLPPATDRGSGMHTYDDRTSDDELARDIDAIHSRISSAQRDLFRLIAEGDRRELWRDSGARDMAHWLWMRHGISDWKAKRWIAASHALETLPLLSAAFASGELGIDKTVELARFATADSEARLIPWARNVSCGCIRRKGDLAVRQSIDDVRDAECARSVSWWYFDDGRRFGLEAMLPAAQGAAVARALERVAEQLPVMPGEEDCCSADARRADALVALASTHIASDADPDRATVVMHAQLDALHSAGGGCEIEGGGVVHAETARRLLCSGRVQMVIEDEAGQPMRMGRLSREPSASMMRQLRYRDSECRFPGCGTRRFTHAHHIVWWKRGAGPISTICFWSVPFTTGWCTNTAGLFGVIRTARSGGPAPTAPATTPAPRRPQAQIFQFTTKPLTW